MFKSTEVEFKDKMAGVAGLRCLYVCERERERNTKREPERELGSGLCISICMFLFINILIGLFS